MRVLLRGATLLAMLLPVCYYARVLKCVHAVYHGRVSASMRLFSLTYYLVALFV